MSDSKNDQKAKPIATSDRKWKGKADYFISMVGYALGVSDVWRFPYLVYRNGGGVFLIPFLIVLVICSFPLIYLEVGMSQFSGGGPYRVWDMCPLFRGVGIAFAVYNFADIVPSILLRCWMLQYVFDSFQAQLPWDSCNNDWNTLSCIGGKNDDIAANISAGVINNMTGVGGEIVLRNTSNLTDVTVIKQGLNAAEEYWQFRVLNLSDDIAELGEFNWKYLIFTFVVRLLIFFTLWKSVEFIGKVMYVTTLVPLLLTLVFLIRALMLPGALDGLTYLFKPDLSKLANINVWIEATFMSFYTLGVAWGGFQVMGSHNKFHCKSLRYVGMTIIFDTLCSILSGCLVFSVLGVMAKETGTDIDTAVSSGISLTFVTIPKAVTYLPLPNLWIIMFIIILLLVSFDAQMMLIETGLSVLEEVFPKQLQTRRPLLAGVVSLVLFIMSIPFMFQNGMYLLQLIDWYLTTFTAALVALLESLVYFWIYGSSRVSSDFEMMVGRPLPVFIRITGAFILPVVMFALLAISIVTYKPPDYGPYIYPDYARAIGWMVAMASVIPIFAVGIFQIWKQQGSFLQRLRQACQPTESWGPADEDLKVLYAAKENQQSTGSTIWLKAKYNLLGDTPSSTRHRKNDHDHELQEKENFLTI